jgi:hypothetical protein
MQDQDTTPRDDTATTRADWLMRMADLGEDQGYFEPLGDHHFAFFADKGSNLLVSFESLDALLDADDEDTGPRNPMADDPSWSHLCIIADGPTWYRDRWVWGYVDRLIDDGFFEDFDRVVFFGAGMGGYAACAFSVAAPGSTVLAIRPLATLDPRQAGWDRRHPEARRLDFTSRFGYAPDMIDGAARVFVLHDPEVDEDAMHAALFRKPFVTRLDCRHIGPSPEAGLADMGLLGSLIAAAADGSLTPALWARMWRSRRNHAAWIRNMAMHLAAGRERRREAVFLRAAVARFPGLRRLRKRQEELTRQLDADGIALPSPRS